MDYKVFLSLQNKLLFANDKKEPLTIGNCSIKDDFSPIIIDFISYCDLNTIGIIKHVLSQNIDLFLPQILQFYNDFSFEMKT